MKKIFSIVMVFVLCIGTVITVNAADSGNCGAGVKYSYNVSQKTLTIGGKGAVDNDVKFSLSGDVTKLVIGNSITAIGSNAFKGFAKLTSVTLGSSLTSIGISSFENCKALKSVKIPASVKGIEEYAFKGCTAMTSLSVSDAKAYIDEYAFMNCTALKSVNLGANVYRIGSMAFHNTAFYKNSANWKNNMLFANSYKYLLKANTAVSGAIKVPAPTRVIAKGSFNYCDKITSVNLPGGLKLVDDFVFRACEKLKSINIPNTVTGIGWNAFAGCVVLTKMIIPSSVKIINVDAFENCSKLAKISISNENCTIYNSQRTLPANAVIYGFKNSTAEKYAGKYARKFVNLKTICIGHESTKTTPATLTKDGSYSIKCSICKTNSTSKILKIGTVSLSQSTFSYDGKVKTPSVIVKNSKGVNLIKNTAYKVTYPSGRKNVGTYKVTVKFIGKYSGEKVLAFKIVPKGTTLTSVAAVKGGFTAKWNKQDVQTGGYQIEYATDSAYKNFTVVTVNNNKKLDTKVTGLKQNTTYYVRVRTYLIGKKTKYYSVWSASKTVKTK